MVHSAGLFVFAMGVPAIYPFALTLVAVHAGFGLLRFRGGLLAFLARLALLGCALGAYYAISVVHGYITPLLAWSYCALSLFAFVAGYSGGRDLGESRSYASLSGLFGGIAGGLTFATLSVVAAGPFANLAHSALSDAERAAPSIWAGTLVTGPILGALAALGMCLVPAVVFGSVSRRSAAVGVLLAGFAASGLYTNVAMQNRTPFLAFAAALILAWLMFVRSGAVTLQRRIVRTALLASLCGVSAVPLIFTAAEPLGFLERFQKQGVETARYEQWGRVLLGFFDHWDGGRAIPLTASFAHNLWLDAAWDTGPVPCILLVLFHVSAILPIVACCRARVDLGPRLVIAGVGCAFFSSAFSEPVLSFPIMYFAFSCYYAGLGLGLSQAWRTSAVIDATVR